MVSFLTKNSSNHEYARNDSDTTILNVNKIGIDDKKDVDLIPPCYWHDLKNIKTPNGVMLIYRLVNDSIYFIDWGKENKIRILPDTFFCDAPAVGEPRFIEENEKYIVLRFGCEKRSQCMRKFLLKTKLNILT